MFHVHLKRMWIVLLLGGVYYTYQLDPTGWQFFYILADFFDVIKDLLFLVLFLLYIIFNFYVTF